MACFALCDVRKKRVSVLFLQHLYDSRLKTHEEKPPARETARTFYEELKQGQEHVHCDQSCSADPNSR